ncbi:MAG: peptide chain release factor 1 [Sedimentisphaerales bacterium]|nr:peptide chain release factor 1 [Sedimentisphaerales bacterium]
MTETSTTLIDKLSEIETRFDELQKQLADPAVACDHTKAVVISKEQGKLKGLVFQFREYKKAATQADETQHLINSDTTDPELKAMAEEELNQLNEKKARLLEELQNKLLTADDDSIVSVIMEIRAGTGGEEAALFARDLYTMYTKYATDRGWKVEDLDFGTTDRGGFREVIFGISGSGVWSQLGYESGCHRVQRVPETEAQGRIHTSAATVAVMPEPEEVDIQIKPEDVVEQVCRSSGPGGQKVNKTSSAIRLEHIPTGITVRMQEEKSQHKNRAKAWRILRSRLYEFYQGQKTAERDAKRKTMIGSGDRSEKIRTYNFPQNRVTDHRINLSLYTLDKIIAGDMKELLKTLKEYDIQQRLKNL